MTYRPIRSAYAIAAAALLGSAALAGPVLAADTPMRQTQLGAAATGAAPAKPARAKAQGDIVERRLAALHKQLKITPQQEDKWTAFAQTVRDNEARMKELVVNRHQARNASAVDDLRNYGEITEEHASSIKRLVGPFGDLYASMPDAQKKNADQVFARYEDRAAAREAGARSNSPAAKPKS
jgi:periplasmic protein CpxP/Spy